MNDEGILRRSSFVVTKKKTPAKAQAEVWITVLQCR